MPRSKKIKIKIESDEEDPLDITSHNVDSMSEEGQATFGVVTNNAENSERDIINCNVLDIKDEPLAPDIVSDYGEVDPLAVNQESQLQVPKRRRSRPRSTSSLMNDELTMLVFSDSDEYELEAFKTGKASAEDPDYGDPELARDAADFDRQEHGLEKDSPHPPPFVWRELYNNPRRFGFKGNPGIKANLDGSSTPMEIFQCLFPVDLVDLIVLETNLYANAFPPPTSSNMEKWKTTSREEIWAYFGLRMTMGMQARLCSHDYWSTNPLLRSEIFTEVMTRDRFDHLSSYIHFAHMKDNKPPEDRLWRIRPIINTLNDSFLSAYVPDKDITIDSIFWGKQLRKRKYVFSLATTTGPATGYTSCFSVYAGDIIPSSTKAIMDLLRFGKCTEKGYQLYVDDRFTTPRLFQSLLAHRTNAIGKAQLNKKFMPNNLQVNYKGDVDYRSSRTGILALQWMGQDIVTLLSTVHRGAEMEEHMPQVLIDYNLGVKGMDCGDKGFFHPTPFEEKAWYRNVFFHLFDLTITNAFALHRAVGGSMDQKTFRLELAAAMLGDFREGTQQNRRGTDKTMRHRLRDQGHTLHRVPDGKKLRCRWCSRSKGIQKLVRNYCRNCGVGLCTFRCFESWHTKTG